MTNISILEPTVRNAHAQYIAQIVATAPLEIVAGCAVRGDIQDRLDECNDIMLATLQYIQTLCGDLNGSLPVTDRINTAEFGAQVVDLLADFSGQFRKLLEDRQ